MRLPSLLGALLHHARHPSPRQESVMAATATAASEADSMLAKMALDCGEDISASQEEILAKSSFLGGDNALSDEEEEEEEEEEVFATPPDATQQQPVIMCTLPFTPTPAKSPAPPSTDDTQTIIMRTLPFTPTPSKSLAPPSSQLQSPALLSDDDAPPSKPRRKPRVCTRKVRGARISTPSLSPEEQEQPGPEQQPQPHLPEKPPHVDPLVRAVLMMPTRTTTAAATSSSTQDAIRDFLALARQKGIF